MGCLKGITIIALLNFIWAFFSLLFATAFFLGFGVVGAGAVSPMRGGASLALAKSLGIVGGILVLGGVEVVAGVGLLKLRNWARILTIILASAGLLLAVRGLVSSLLHGQVLAVAIGVVILVFYTLIVWYMFQPRVKRAFGVP